SSAVISGDYVLISSDNPTLSSFIKTGRNARDVKEAIFRVTGRKYRLGIRNAAAEQETPQQEHKAEDPLENLIGRAKDMGINIDIRN
ncbi:MAG: hypothetical protein PUB43_06675, partial [Oscillospiraceae bacterium]|nr:hypothetical protein [Oscillospiraceae bacterium]